MKKLIEKALNENYTPGPWKVAPQHAKIELEDQHRDAFVAVSAGQVDFFKVFVSGSDRAERQANAKLIAAAPDLLDALQMAMRALEDNNIDEMMAGEYEILTDAVAKATGGQA